MPLEQIKNNIGTVHNRARNLSADAVSLRLPEKASCEPLF